MRYNILTINFFYLEIEKYIFLNLETEIDECLDRDSDNQQ